MGLGVMRSTCSVNPAKRAPNPSCYRVIEKKYYPNATLVVAKYYGCTNFEGKKILVFLGKKEIEGALDPHFCDSNDSPIARFKPDELGRTLAIALCLSLEELVVGSDNT